MSHSARRSFRTSLTLGLLVATLAASAPLHAHGGNFPQPGAPIPRFPGPGQPGPSGPGGAATTGSGGGARRAPASTAASSAASTAAAAGTRSRSGPDSGTGTGSGIVELSTFDSWEFWWEVNRDRFLDLKERLDAAHNSSGSPGFLTGRGRRHARNGSRSVLREITRVRVVPRLLQVLEEAEHGDLLASTLLAVARTAEGAHAVRVLEHSVRLLAHHELDVQASAALSVGILGARRASTLLEDLLMDTSAGRASVGGGRTPELVRAFAALGLGMLGSSSGVDTLMECVRELRDAEREVKNAALTALGLLPADHPRAPDVRVFLEERLAEHGLDDSLRASAVLALGRLGRREAVPALSACLTAPRTSNPVRRSAALALGVLAEMADGEAVDALLATLTDESDAPTRHFALMSLAEIGARDAAPDDHPGRHTLIVERLRTELDGDGRSRSHRPWAGLAAALYARGQEPARGSFAARLRHAFEDEKGPSARSAYALGLGLLGDQGAAASLREQWIDLKDPTFRGFTALSLGFLGEPLAVDELRATLTARGTPASLRLRTAIALGLMRDRTASGALVETLQASGSMDVHAAATRGLALLGSPDSIDVLLGIVERDDEQEQVRAFASVALGLTGERTALPWNEPLRAHANYLLDFTALREVMDLF